MVADMGAEETGTSRLAEVYERSAPAGFRLAYLLTGDRALAEDLVQEAFLRFVGRLHHLREPEAFDAYLRRTIKPVEGCLPPPCGRAVLPRAADRRVP